MPSVQKSKLGPEYYRNWFAKYAALCVLEMNLTDWWGFQEERICESTDLRRARGFKIQTDETDHWEGASEQWKREERGERDLSPMCTRSYSRLSALFALLFLFSPHFFAFSFTSSFPSFFYCLSVPISCWFFFLFLRLFWLYYISPEFSLSHLFSFLSLYLCLSMSIFLTLSLPLSFSIYLSLSLCFSLYLSPCLYLSLHHLCLNVSMREKSSSCCCKARRVATIPLQVK